MMMNPASWCVMGTGLRGFPRVEFMMLFIIS